MTKLGCAYVAQQSAVTEDPDTDGDKNPFLDCRLIFVGSSHSAKMATAADNARFDTKNFLVLGFPINPDNIKTTAVLL
jgi:hypothetical protein